MFNKKQSQHLSIGQRGEKAAEKYLRSLGYKILELNFKNNFGRRLGEIDIIAKEDDEIVFVEVKTRISPNEELILPEENITPAKLYKLNKISSFYMSSNKLFSSNYRFDAITVSADPTNNKARLKHFKNIFL